MILALDIGNTHIVLGCIEDGKILHTARIHTATHDTETEYAVRLKDLLELYGIGLRGFEAAILSSVVPPVTEVLAEAVLRVTGLKCMLVVPGIRTGLNIRIDDPGTLAGDLIVGAIAAATCYGTPAIVLDMGTATTIVAIDGNNCYRGGAILPGVKLSYAALASGTSLLPDISVTAPKRAVATNTVDAMRSGAVFGTAAAIDGMIERMEAELGCKCKIVATGGLARAVIPYCKREIICDKDLLLKGLWALYEKNRK